MMAPVVATLALLTGPSTGGLELRVRPLKDTYRKGESVVVEISVRNPLTSKEMPHSSAS
jgi:hypothetical protein